MRNFWSIVLLILICFSCDNKQLDPTADDTSVVHEDTLLLDARTYLKPSLALTVEATKAVENWTTYQTLRQNLKNRDTLNVGKLKGYIAALNSGFSIQGEADDALVKTIPSKLDLPAIQARLLAVETQVKVLANHLEKVSLDKNRLAIEWGGLHNAFQNLNLQINERFSVSVEELLEEARSFDEDEPDSIQTGKPPIEKL